MKGAVIASKADTGSSGETGLEGNVMRRTKRHGWLVENDRP